MDISTIKARISENRSLQFAAVLFVLFLLYLIYLFLLGFRSKVSDEVQIQVAIPEALAKAPGEKKSGVSGKKEPVIFSATFDEQGFPVKAPENVSRGHDDLLIGRKAILKTLQERMGGTSPEQAMKDFQGQFSYYWKDPASPDFLAGSQEMGDKLKATAGRNRKLVQSVYGFLKSDAGKQVSATLKDNLVKATVSPAREIMKSGFSAWKIGDLDSAYRLLKQAEAADPDSSYIQIIAHQGMAFLNMQKHGPLEETMRQYRDLAEEAHKYIKSFKPVLEKAGFDPGKLYGRDPFDASGLPNKDQFEKAMNDSKYIQFEREYYRTHARGTGRTLNEMQKDTIDYIRKRQKGGEK